MKDVVIISAVRTPVGKYMGALKTLEAYDLGAIVLDQALKRIGLSPENVDEVVMAQSYQNGESVNVARMSLLKAGWPESVTGITIDRRCCSGLDVIRFASSLIKSGDAEIVVAGGVESMSNGEFYLPGNIKWGIGGSHGMPRGHGDLKIWGLPFYDRLQRARVMSQPEERYGILPSMMSWAETAAREENVTRSACDAWAVQSHRKACAAIKAGKFKDEIIPVHIPQAKGDPVILDQDENPREDTSIEKLAKLKPVLGGVCTAGNSSTENDGAAAVVITTPEKARELGVDPYAYVRSCAIAGDDPRRTHRTVPAAVNKALSMANVFMDQMALIEIQEAFAAQVLADLKEMGLTEADYHKINVNGSGISLGHPISCTGVRVLVTLLHEMKRRNARFGLECICGGGGQGIAAVFERF
ncbi:MAG: acetyl-CoA C-acyltransferase [Proteobacteria bacterium]|nr:acetyl-CoA C-acyltransferase [Pseudomonadota bacterium]